MQHFFSQISVYDVWGWVMAALAAVAVVDKAIDIFHKWRKASPDGKQEEKLKELDRRVTKLEHDAEQYTGFFRDDKARLDMIEEGNRVIQEGMLALLSHAVDGNDIDACNKAKTDLQDYLIGKKKR